MPFTFHTHSGQFCYHAAGTLEGVVQAAIAARLEYVGCSEHMPRQRMQDLYPEELEADATPDQLAKRFDAYIHEARRLRQLYADRIRVVIGMESEFIYPQQAKEVAELRRHYALDYVIGSVHHVHGHPIDFDDAMLSQAQTASGGTLESLLLAYFDAQQQMVRALQPEIVGHIDVIRRRLPPGHATAWPEAVYQCIRETARLVAQYGGLVEINTAAWKCGFQDPYPQPSIMQIFREAGCRFTLADDAHCPEQVAVYHTTQLRDYLVACGIDTVYALAPLEDTDHDSTASANEKPFARVRVVPYANIAQHSFWTA